MGQPTVYPEATEDELDIDTELLLVIGDQEPGDITVSPSGKEGTAAAWIPANKRRSAARKILGYSYADDAEPFKLHRELPLRHPIFPDMYAYAVSFQGVAPKANTENENNAPVIESPFEGGNGELLRYTGYQQCLATIKFKSWGRMRFLPDSDIGNYLDEYKRYVRFMMDPAVEALSAEGVSQLLFREGSGTNQPLADETPFPAPLAELMTKAAFSIKWYGVPHNYLSSDPDILLLDKILPLLGSTNSSAFLGYRIGELLLTAVKAEEVSYPVAVADPFEVAGGWDVTGVWEYFSPEKGIADSPPGTSPYFGHRLFPSRFGGWFYANRADSASEFYPQKDHWNFFKHQAA